MRGLSTSPPNPILPLYELDTSPTRRSSHQSRPLLSSIPYRDSPSNPSSPSPSLRELHKPQATSRHLRADSPASHSSTKSPSHRSHSPAPASSLFSQPATASEAELLALVRQTAHISKTLQTLLDAQSQGLLAGLAGESPQPEPQLEDDNSEPTTPTPFSSKQPSRSSTPTLTSSSPPPNSTNPAYHRNAASQSKHAFSRRSRPPRISLHAARTHIPRTLLSLSELKTQETAILSTSLSTLNARLNSLTKHESRHEALSQRIASISSDPNLGTPSIERLQAQETELSHEIEELEDRLANLRAKRRHLKGEIELKTNHLDAKLSSYKTALEDLDKDAHSRFLRADPLFPASSTPPQSALSFSRVFPLSKPSDSSYKENQNVWALPPSRRTLPLVRADFETRITGLTQRLQASDLEARASAEGAQLWTSVLEVLERTEIVIRESMSRQQEILGRGDLDEGRRKAVLEGDTKALIGVVEDALGELSEAEAVTQKRGWNFLVCAVGAEVEALVRGREVLSGLLREETGGSHDRKLVLAGKEELEKAQSVQDIRKERKVEGDRPSSAGSGSGRMRKTHGRQSSFPTLSWSRKASAVEPKLTRNDVSQKGEGGLDGIVQQKGNGLAGREGNEQAASASHDGASTARGSVDKEESLLEELNGGEVAQGDEDELLRDLMSGGQ